jgi:hypothetical protein
MHGHSRVYFVSVIDVLFLCLSVQRKNTSYSMSIHHTCSAVHHCPKQILKHNSFKTHDDNAEEKKTTSPLRCFVIGPFADTLRATQWTNNSSYVVLFWNSVMMTPVTTPQLQLLLHTQHSPRTPNLLFTVLQYIFFLGWIKKILSKLLSKPVFAS